MPFFRVPVSYYVQADNLSAAIYAITNFVYDDPQLPMLAYDGATIVDVEGDHAESLTPEAMQQIIDKYPPLP